MKEAEKIINGIKYWFDEDQKNRTAVVILADKKESDVWGLSKGTTSKIALLIHTLMIENKDLGHDIYMAACIYAHRHITAEADKFRCCGVCANYRYEVAAKGRCKWPSYKASQMRPACKRFERVNEKTELYNDYSAKGVNIK